MSISGFGGDYRFLCNRASSVSLDECLLERGVELRLAGSGPSNKIAIEKGAWVGRNTTINVVSACLVREHTMIAAGSYLCDFRHGLALGTPMLLQELAPVGDHEGMVIGPDAWLGANVVVIGRLRIGAGAVVGANSVVTTDVPPLEIWAGVPARKVGVRR